MLKRLFEIDPRSLGLFRILLGVLLVCLSVDRFTQAAAFFTDWGLMPRTYWINEYMGKNSFSLHLASGQLWFQQLLILLQGLAAFAFMIGFRPKVFGFVTLVLLSSLQSRNNLILSCADDLIRLALLWSLFLPLQDTFAIQQKNSAGFESTKSSIFNAAILLQLLFVYFFTALLKNHPIWLKEGSAVYYALNIDIYTKPLGVWLRSHAELMRFATFSTLFLEIVGPFAALLAGWPRFFVSLLFISFHAGLLLTLELDYFPWIAAIYWILFWPKELWETSLGKIISTKLCSFFEQVKKITGIVTSDSAPTSRLCNLSLQVICGAMLVLVASYNINKLTENKGLVPKALLRTTESLYLFQSWDMFAPYPIRNDGWFVIEGIFKDGSKRNLVEGSATYTKPALPSQIYSSGAMRKFMVNVWDKGDRKILLPYGRYLCRKYSKENGEKNDIQFINVIFMKETTPPEGESWPDVESISLWNHDCFAMQTKFENSSGLV